MLIVGLRRGIVVLGALALVAGLMTPAGAYPRPGLTERVSLASDGTQGNGTSRDPAISTDGRHVAFYGNASNLVPGDTNGETDVFVRDRGGSLSVVGTPSVLNAPGGVGVSGRATVAGATLPAVPHVALYRCAPDCTEHAPLTGSFGTNGDQVLVSVPLSALEAPEGTELTGLRAFTAVGEAALGSVETIDEVALPDATILESRVELGIAPASTPEDQVAFAVDADLHEGEFSGTVPTAGLSPGSHRVWARACLGDACGPAAFGEAAL